jgi:adenine phosphoribosyltransferase
MVLLTLDQALGNAIRTIPDYPKPGILLRSITTRLGNARAFRRAIDEMAPPHAGIKVDQIAGIGERGFILGGAIAHQLSSGLVPIRDRGKLPYETARIAYSLQSRPQNIRGVDCAAASALITDATCRK